MKKTKTSIYLRYEFSDEKGRPEGGDIFRFSTMAQVKKMATDILKVAHSDGVTVNLTIGEEVPFFGFLEEAGMSRKQAEEEMVNRDVAKPAKKKKTSARKKK